MDQDVTRACFSNTNDLHWERQFDDFGFDRMFDELFVSFEMGRVKPDREAFEWVVERLDVEPHEILFLDDNAINVEGARAVGIDAERAVGVAGAREILKRRGLLGPR